MIFISSSPSSKLIKKLSNKLCHFFDGMIIDYFVDGELYVKIYNNLHKQKVVLLHAVYPEINSNYMKLLFMIDAIYRAQATSLQLVIPYLAYSRQYEDNNSQKNSRNYFNNFYMANGLKIISKLLQLYPIERVISCELHNHMALHSSLTINNLPISTLIAEDIKLFYDNQSRIVLVAPDEGSSNRVFSLKKFLQAKGFVNISNTIVMQKTRYDDQNIIISSKIPSKLLQQSTCILIDDIVSTAQTLIQAADIVHIHGAQKIIAYCCHPVLAGEAVAKIVNSVIDMLIVSDTIDLPQEALLCSKIRQISWENALFSHLLEIS